MSFLNKIKSLGEKIEQINPLAVKDKDQQRAEEGEKQEGQQSQEKVRRSGVCTA